MKIGIDARMLGPKQTGIGRYVQHLIDGLKEKRGAEFVLFLRQDQFDRIDEQNISKIKTSSRWYSWGEQTSFLRKLRREACDLIHFPHFSHPIFYSAPFVITIHDLTPFYYPGKNTPVHRKLAYRLVLRSACKRAEKIIAPSFHTKKDILEHFNLSDDKVEVIYEGVRFAPRLKQVFDSSYLDYKQKIRRELTEKFPSLGNSEYIFYTGVWRYHKNIVGLLEGFKILKEDFGFAGKLVLGGGPKKKEKRRVRAMIEKRGLGEQVITPGFLSEKDLRQFYRGASVFVLASFYEGFGLGGLEASSQGTPVCCSKIGPLPEVMKESALYFDPENSHDIATKINKIISDQELAQKLLVKAKKNLSRFSWDKMTKNTYDIYLKVLNKGKGK
jgi:glycosyltransferase involved in cell wall biosynthesis